MPESGRAAQQARPRRWGHGASRRCTGARPTQVAAPSQATLALLDLSQGARAHHLWYLLAWQDIRRLYRRSVLGPFWLTISMGALVGVLGTLYGMFEGWTARTTCPSSRSASSCGR